MTPCAAPSAAGWWKRDLMLILGIESATTQVGCAIGGHEGVLASFHSARGQRHAETLAPAIDFVRRHALIEFDELGAIAVDVGPGLFTGLRVGIATAKALAQTLRIPMIGVSSLDLLAFRRWPVRDRCSHRITRVSCDHSRCPHERSAAHADRCRLTLEVRGAR